MSLPSLKGRVAVITGASRGIGLGLTEVFAEHGMHLGLCARTLPRAPPGVKSLCRSVDVGDERAVEAFADEVWSEIGPAALWVNNAGILAPVGPLRELDTKDLERHLRVNLFGVFFGCRAYVRRLRAELSSRRPQNPVLINVSSGAAQSGYAGWVPYCSAKAGVDRLSECLQLEEADAGLSVYSVAPGVVDTQMQAELRRCSPEQFPMLDKFLRLKTEGRFSSARHVASELLKLAFDPAQRARTVVVRLPPEKP